MKLSVIIPYLNAAGTIPATLDSLIAQSWPVDWELIVADNGSRQKPETILDSYQTKLPSLKIIDASAKSGAAYARNLAVKASTGDNLLFVDADDVPGRGWAAAMAAALLHHSLVAARFDFNKLNPVEIATSRGGTQTSGLQICHFLPFPHAGAGSIGVSRLAHDSVGGFDETILIGEDADYCMKMHLAGHELVFVPDAVLHYRLRTTPSETFAQAVTYAKHNIYLYKKYGRRSSWELWRWRAYFRSCRALIHRAPALARTRGGRPLLAWRVGTHIGALSGSLRFGVAPVMHE